MRPVLNPDKVHKAAASAMKSFHPDFIEEIEKTIASNEWVIVGMAQNPVVKQARGVLDSKNQKYAYIGHGNYLTGWKRRLAVKLWSGWPTFPQVFHKGVLIGGCKDLIEYLK
ncbi:MAG: glutaredoxin [Bdellovibrionota bacterium]